MHYNIQAVLDMAKAERDQSERLAALVTTEPEVAEQASIYARQLCVTIFHLERALESLGADAMHPSREAFYPYTHNGARCRIDKIVAPNIVAIEYMHYDAKAEVLVSQLQPVNKGS